MASAARQWITRAYRKSNTPERFQECLAAAEAAASKPGEWLDMAQIVVDRGGTPSLAHRYLERAVDGQPPGSVDAELSIRIAQTWLDLHQPSRAKDTITNAANAVLATRSRTRISGLCLLSEALVTLITDRVEAARWLDSASRIAKTPAHFAQIAAVLFADVRDAQGARTMLERATVAASRQPAGEPISAHGWSDISNVEFRVMADAEAARRTLRQGLSHIESVVGILVLAAAWRRYFGRLGGFEEFVQVATERASRTQDHIEVAEAVFDAHREASSAPRSEATWRSEVRAHLECGLAVATNEAERRLVAEGFESFLDDSEAAERIIPTG